MRRDQWGADLVCPAFACERASHDECWRDYSRQEDEAKYE